MPAFSMPPITPTEPQAEPSSAIPPQAQQGTGLPTTGGSVPAVGTSGIQVGAENYPYNDDAMLAIYTKAQEAIQGNPALEELRKSLQVDVQPLKLDPNTPASEQKQAMQAHIDKLGLLDGIDFDAAFQNSEAGNTMRGMLATLSANVYQKTFEQITSRINDLVPMLAEKTFEQVTSRLSSREAFNDLIEKNPMMEDKMVRPVAKQMYDTFLSQTKDASIASKLTEKFINDLLKTKSSGRDPASQGMSAKPVDWAGMLTGS